MRHEHWKGIGVWCENGRRRSRILGRVLDRIIWQARALLDKTLASIQVRLASWSSTITFGKFVEAEYLTVRGPAWTTSTRFTAELIIRTHILPAFRERLVSSITRNELQEFLDSKVAKGLSWSAVNFIRCQLVAIFEFARASNVVTFIPVRALKVPGFRKCADKHVVFDEDLRRGEMMLDDRDRLLYRLAGFDGMRPSEIEGIKLGDIQYGVVHVARRIHLGVIELSVRRVLLSSDSLTVLQRYIASLGHAGPDAWLFPSQNPAKPVRYADVYRRRIQPRLKEIGLAQLNAHALRRAWRNRLGRSHARTLTLVS